MARRKFLQKLSLLLGSSYFSMAAAVAGQSNILAPATNLKQGKKFGDPAASAELGKRFYSIAPWTGDDFTLGHRLRDADFPKLPDKASRSVDVAIIGGGIAGLTAAYYLRNHNFLLLEQYDSLGGQARGGSYRGIEYSYGSAVLASNSARVDDLIAELGLKPQDFDTSRNSFRVGQQWLAVVDDSKGDRSCNSNSLNKEFAAFHQEAQPIFSLIETEALATPLSNGELLRLDKLPFLSCLQKYSPDFIQAINSFCKACYCANVDQISALAGYAITLEFYRNCRMLPGGNSAIPKALMEAISRAGNGRLLSSKFVWSVEITTDGAAIIFGDKDGHTEKITCRHVILTSPLMVSARILQNVDNLIKAKMLSFRYGSYLVANCLLKRKVFSGALSNWVSRPFSFADIMIAEAPYEKAGKYQADMGSVLTVYQPYAPASEGRTLLLEGNREKLADQIVCQVSELAEPLEGILQQVVLTRWGHAIAVPNLGYFERISNLAANSVRQYSLAHNSTYGLPSVVSAINAGYRAAQKALAGI